MLGAAREAADLLAAEGVEATVWDVRVVPLDPEMLADAAGHPAGAHHRGRRPRGGGRLADRRRDLTALRRPRPAASGCWARRSSTSPTASPTPSSPASASTAPAWPRRREPCVSAPARSEREPPGAPVRRTQHATHRDPRAPRQCRPSGACGDDAGEAVSTSGTEPADADQIYEADLTVLQSPDHGPELCYVVAESLPPQCGGPSVVRLGLGRRRGRGTGERHDLGDLPRRRDLVLRSAPPHRSTDGAATATMAASRRRARLLPGCADPEVVDATHGVEEWEQASAGRRCPGPGPGHLLGVGPDGRLGWPVHRDRRRAAGKRRASHARPFGRATRGRCAWSSRDAPTEAELQDGPDGGRCGEPASWASSVPRSTASAAWSSSTSGSPTTTRGDARERSVGRSRRAPADPAARRLGSLRDFERLNRSSAATCRRGSRRRRGRWCR